MIRKRPASLDDLYAAPGKAEFVDGEIVLMSPSGIRPNWAAGRIYVSLSIYRDARGSGLPFTDNASFLVNLPHRRSFSPDVAWCEGTLDDLTMKYFSGPPAFAVEVRSEYDYGPAAEKAIRAKIADYFAAGTLVVWDVDLQSDDVVRCFRAASPESPEVFARHQVADAEPAVPGWRFNVESLFR